MHGFEMQLFAMQLRRLTVTLKFPRKHSCMALVVSERFTIGRLMFLTEMRSSRFVPLQRVNAHELGESAPLVRTPGIRASTVFPSDRRDNAAVCWGKQNNHQPSLASAR